MFGLIETCLAFKNSGASSISGLILINSTPFSKHFEIPFSVICLPTPPAETFEFFNGIPPNIKMSSHSFESAPQEVCSSNVEYKSNPIM